MISYIIGNWYSCIVLLLFLWWWQCYCGMLVFRRCWELTLRCRHVLWYYICILSWRLGHVCIFSLYIWSVCYLKSGHINIVWLIYNLSHVDIIWLGQRVNFNTIWLGHRLCVGYIDIVWLSHIWLGRCPKFGYINIFRLGHCLRLGHINVVWSICLLALEHHSILRPVRLCLEHGNVIIRLTLWLERECVNVV